MMTPRNLCAAMTIISTPFKKMGALEVGLVDGLLPGFGSLFLVSSITPNLSIVKLQWCVCDHFNLQDGRTIMFFNLSLASIRVFVHASSMASSMKVTAVSPLLGHTHL